MITMNNKPTMSEFTKKAQDPLKNCEIEVRRLGGEALEAGSYKQAELLAKLAQKIGQMHDSLNMGETAVIPERGEPVELVAKSTEPIEQSRFSQPLRVPTKKPKKARRRGGRPEGYPYFEVEGNHLVKVSWSKTKKDSYVHKAPKRVLEKLVETLLTMGSNKEVIPTEKMFPLVDGENKYPDYQSYLCLLWLKRNKLVIHQGREGYQVRDPEIFEKQCEQLWEEFDS